MTRSQAVDTLENIEGILREVSRLDSLSMQERSNVMSRAQREVSNIDDVVRLLKRLDSEVNG
jgi:hypothetical protein